MPTIEGRLLPAASPMRLLDYRESLRAGWTAFTGESRRLRPGCSFRRIEWYHGRRGGRSVPVGVKLDPPQVRPDGVTFRFTWEANITPPEVLAEGTYADVVHQCSIFYSIDEDGKASGGIELPWETRTRFYDPKR